MTRSNDWPILSKISKFLWDFTMEFSLFQYPNNYNKSITPNIYYHSPPPFCQHILTLKVPDYLSLIAYIKRNSSANKGNTPTKFKPTISLELAEQ